jgi:hypothetical protein
MRWLAGGMDAAWRWDAYLPPTGCPLPRLVEGNRPLPWAAARVVLQDLADELNSACQEGTLPETLTVEQIWVANGHAQLLDVPWCDRTVSPAGAPNADPERALTLLRQAAILMLEGKTRDPSKKDLPIRAPLPLYTAKVLRPLVGGHRLYAAVQPFQERLRAISDKPAAVRRVQRFEHIGLITVLHFTAWFLLYALLTLVLQFDDPSVTLLSFLFVAPWIPWAFLTRGGVSLPAMEMALVDATGCPAARWRCAVRASLFWLATIGLGVAMANGVFPESVLLAYFSPDIPVILDEGGVPILIYLTLALWSPVQAPHDRLAGTYLVPR